MFVCLIADDRPLAAFFCLSTSTPKLEQRDSPAACKEVGNKHKHISLTPHTFLIGKKAVGSQPEDNNNNIKRNKGRP